VPAACGLPDAKALVDAANQRSRPRVARFTVLSLIEARRLVQPEPRFA
jgi:hypothetical protein